MSPTPVDNSAVLLEAVTLMSPTPVDNSAVLSEAVTLMQWSTDVDGSDWYLVIVEGVNQGDEAPGFTLAALMEQWYVSNNDRVEVVAQLQVVHGTERLQNTCHKQL